MDTEERLEQAAVARDQARESLGGLMATASAAVGEVEVSALPAEVQTAVARAQVGLIAAVFPLASIGTCKCDGTDLLFENHDDGLYVCCANGHCWKIA